MTLLFLQASTIRWKWLANWCLFAIFFWQDSNQRCHFKRRKRSRVILTFKISFWNFFYLFVGRKMIWLYWIEALTIWTYFAIEALKRPFQRNFWTKLPPNLPSFLVWDKSKLLVQCQIIKLEIYQFYLDSKFIFQLFNARWQCYPLYSKNDRPAPATEISSESQKPAETTQK